MRRRDFDYARLAADIRSGDTVAEASARQRIDSSIVRRRAKNDAELEVIIRAALAERRGSRAQRARRESAQPCGTPAAFKRGCRCEPCTAANKVRRSDDRARWRGRTPPAHGISGYTHWGCRCATCRAANTSVMMKPKHRDRAADATKRRQAATIDGARRYGYRWTGPEIELLERRDLTARQVAAMLGRTLYAVQHQRHVLSKDPRKQAML